jgi:hypothetical protein
VKSGKWLYEVSFVFERTLRRTGVVTATMLPPAPNMPVGT